MLLVIGPEGGFDRAEVERARAHGFATTGLGPRILRADTAAVAACTLAQYGYGDMGVSMHTTNDGGSTTVERPSGGRIDETGERSSDGP